MAVGAGIEKDKTAIQDSRKDVFLGNSLHTLMRVDLERHGVKTMHMNGEQLFQNMIRMFGTGSSDLPLVFEASNAKSMKAGYDGAPTTWQIWGGRKTVNNFNEHKIVGVSGFADFKLLPENGEFEDSKISDSRETYSIDTYGRKYSVSRKAFINDDMSVFTSIPMKMGRASARTVNRLVYDKLCFNSLVGPAMSDSIALFNSAHSNLKTSSGVVSVVSIGLAEKMLMDMPLLSPENGAAVQRQNVGGKYIVTGNDNMVSILQTLGSGMDISKSIVGVMNPYTLGNKTPVFDAYLQALITAGSAANTWYYVADQMDVESIGVAFLSGNESPTLRQAESGVGEALGLVYDGFFDVGVYVADWHGIIKNDGKT
jgi:hypothetical protein